MNRKYAVTGIFGSSSGLTRVSALQVAADAKAAPEGPAVDDVGGAKAGRLEEAGEPPEGHPPLEAAPGAAAAAGAAGHPTLEAVTAGVADEGPPLVEVEGAPRTAGVAAGGHEPPEGAEALPLLLVVGSAALGHALPAAVVAEVAGGGAFAGVPVALVAPKLVERLSMVGSQWCSMRLSCVERAKSATRRLHSREQRTTRQHTRES
jgi:hypothetical protein